LGLQCETKQKERTEGSYFWHGLEKLEGWKTLVLNLFDAGKGTFIDVVRILNVNFWLIVLVFGFGIVRWELENDRQRICRVIPDGVNI